MVSRGVRKKWARLSGFLFGGLFAILEVRRRLGCWSSQAHIRNLFLKWWPMSDDHSRDLSLNCVVRVKAGNFADFVGYIDRLDAANQVAIVMILVYGRGTPVECTIGDLERIEEPPGFDRSKFSCQTQGR